MHITEDIQRIKKGKKQKQKQNQKTQITRLTNGPGISIESFQKCLRNISEVFIISNKWGNTNQNGFLTSFSQSE